MLEIGRAALLFLLHSTVPPTVTTSRELVQWALTWSALPETNFVVWFGGEICQPFCVRGGQQLLLSSCHPWVTSVCTVLLFALFQQLLIVTSVVVSMWLKYVLRCANKFLSETLYQGLKFLPWLQINVDVRLVNKESELSWSRWVPTKAPGRSLLSMMRWILIQHCAIASWTNMFWTHAMLA